MSLHQVWVASHSLASTSADILVTVAARLRSGLGKNVNPFQGAPGQKGHGWQAAQYHRSLVTSFPYANGASQA